MKKKGTILFGSIWLLFAAYHPGGGVVCLIGRVFVNVPDRKKSRGRSVAPFIQ